MAKKKSVVSAANERFDEPFLLRCTATELARWRECAERDGRTLSNWLRRAANLLADAES